MKTPERREREAIAGARGLVREIIELAEEQGWQFRIKDEGFLFYPPKEVARPGMDRVFCNDPRNDSGLARVIRDRFKKAGLKFPEDSRPTRTATVVNNKPNMPHAVTPQNPIAAVKQKLNEVIDLCSEIESLLAKIEEDNQGLQKLRELIKGI